MKKQIVKNLFSNYLTNFLQIIAGFVLIPFLIRKLGQDAFGLTVLAESTIGLFEMFAISIRISLSRYATFSLAQSRKDEFLEYLASGQRILIFSTLIVLILGAVLGMNFPRVFKVPEALATQSKLLFLLVMFGFMMNVMSAVFWSILYAKQRYDLINSATSAGVLFRALSIFVLFSVLGPQCVNIVTYGCIFLSMCVIQNGLVFFWQRKTMPDLKISQAKFSWDKAKSILSFGFHNSINSMSSMLYTNTTNILINVFWGPSFNAIYAISLKIPTILRSFFTYATWALTPTFTDLVAKNDHKRFELLFFSYTKMISIVTIPITLFFIVFAGPIIHMWVGDEFLLSARIMPIQLFPLLLTIPLAVCGCITTAYAKVKIPSLVSLGFAVINVLLGIILFKMFSLGLYGFAIASTLSIALNMGIFLPYYSCRISSVSFRKYYIENILKVVGWNLLFVGAGLIGIFVAQGDFRFSVSLLVTLSLTILLYFLSSYFVLLRKHERDHAFEIINQIRLKFISAKATPEQIVE